MNSTVGVSDFVKRQIKNTGKTYSSLTFEEIATYAEKKLNKGVFKEGYRDGVVLISVDKRLHKKFICPFVKIDMNTKLKAEVNKRRNNEEHYIRIKAIDGKELETGNVEIILYRNDVLKETKEQSTKNDWELNSFHAIPKGIKSLPMGPVTMMRNQLQLKGGTKGHYKSEQWAESVYFWQNYAIKE